MDYSTGEVMTDRGGGPAARARAAGPRAPWCAGTATSTTPRTPCRRPCWTRPPSGATGGVPGQPARLAGHRGHPAAGRDLASGGVPPPPGGERGGRSGRAGAERDRRLPELLLLCCHPALTRPSQVALTLRAVGGLATAEIARAFLVPEATIASGSAGPRRPSAGRGAVRAAARRRAGRPDRHRRRGRLPHLHRGAHGQLRRGGRARRPHRRGHPAGPVAAHRAGRDDRLAAHRGELAGLLALLLLTDARAASRVGEVAGWSRWPSRTAAPGTGRGSRRASSW